MNSTSKVRHFCPALRPFSALSCASPLPNAVTFPQYLTLSVQRVFHKWVGDSATSLYFCLSALPFRPPTRPPLKEPSRPSSPEPAPPVTTKPSPLAG